MLALGKTKSEVLSEFRTAAILEAARRAFAQKGFHDVTVDEIAEAAGVAKGTLYLYYRSKHQIYWDALKQGIEELYSELARQMGHSGDIRAQIEAFVETKIRYFDANHDFFRIYFAEFGNALSHPAHISKDFKKLYTHQARLLESALRRAIQRNTIRRIRPDATAYAISEITRGVITQRLLGASQGKVEDEVAFICDLVWKGIGN